MAQDQVQAEGKFVVVGTHCNPGKAPFALPARQVSMKLRMPAALVTLGGAEREVFRRTAEALACKHPALAELGMQQKAQWRRPEMVVRVRHLKGGDLLRRGSVQAVVAERN